MADDDVQLRLVMPKTWDDWFREVEAAAAATGLPYEAFYPPHPSIVEALGPIPKPPAKWSKGN